jgi:hypothetical protein
MRLILEEESYSGPNFGNLILDDIEIYNRTGSPSYLNDSVISSTSIGVSLDDRFMIAATNG